MHKQNLETLRNEALRLLALEEEVLLRIRDTLGLLKGQDGQEAETFTESKIGNDLEVLAGERKKLQNLDMVIAVVGTMKAGKSTTINAIVGAEVLPNRNSPMTSIPTLIRHVPDQVVPVVKFENNGPINTLCSQIKDVLNDSRSRVEKLRRESRDMDSLISFIEKGEKIHDTYSGEAGIFEFLKMVNDLVRLCRELKVDFPFGEYDEIHELPVIEVEFASLAGREDGFGTVTLLDTPGPNEAGQVHLRLILRDQLQKASAVLAVLNFTQLRSDSDEELRNEVRAIADVSKGRMFALVNRFDERGRHDPDEKEIRLLVANKLLDKSIPEEAVFAVSAEQALLGEMVRKSLDMHNRLPDPEQFKWVEDFARDCLGRHWKSKLDDTQLLREEARYYTDNSGFEEPLNKVIRMAYENAANYALDSAASKIVFYAEKISNFVNGRGTALKKTRDELRSHINALRDDIDQIAQLRSEKERDAEALFAELEQKMSAEFDRLENEIRAATDRYFKEGKAQEINQNKELQRNAGGLTTAQRMEKAAETTFDQKKRGRPNFSILIGPSWEQRESGKEVFDPSKRLLEFPTREKATEFVSKVYQSFYKPISQVDNSLYNIIQNALGDLDQQINKNIAKECQIILTRVAKRLSDGGFDISFKLPQSLSVKTTSLAGDVLMAGIIQGQKEVTRLKEQDSFVGKIKRFFGSIFDTDWGYDEHQVKIDVFRVNLDDLKAIADNVVKDKVASWRYEVDSSVKKPIKVAISEFFNELSGKIEAVRADLLQGLEDKKKSHKEQEELYQALLELGKPVPGIKEDSEALKYDAAINLGQSIQ